MCDGVTQGQPGMELSLFSRDVIALAAGVALSPQHLRRGAVSGRLRQDRAGADHRGRHLRPYAGGLRAGRADDLGLPNDEKSKVRQQFATGEVGRDALMAAEMASYHGPGTCTFYGTANTNQMLMEFMGLHLPGSSFVNPGTPLREALTTAAVNAPPRSPRWATTIRPAGEVLDERAFVNGIVGLMATGGSTNLVLHLPAMARAAGVMLDLEDFHDLSEAVPLMAGSIRTGWPM
jgi:phosphogluconate dehydratase